MINYELDDGVYSQSTVLIKYLTLPSGQCKHTNVVKKSKLDNHAQYLVPAITKSITQTGQKTLKRITEVRFMKIQYTIQDLYDFQTTATPFLANPSLERAINTFSNESGQSNNSASREAARPKAKGKKLCIFHKVIGEGNRLAKRNTKNIPKNFCKAFLSHMNNSKNKESADWQTAMKDFKKIQRKYKNKYNNILMHRMLSNPRIGYFFQSFLKENAEDWIRSSKISDKEVHLEAIAIYSNLLNRIVYAQADPSPSDQ